MTPEIAQQNAYMFDIRPTLRYESRFMHYGMGNKPFLGANPPYGALVTYY